MTGANGITITDTDIPQIVQRNTQIHRRSTLLHTVLSSLILSVYLTVEHGTSLSPKTFNGTFNVDVMIGLLFASSRHL